MFQINESKERVTDETSLGTINDGTTVTYLYEGCSATSVFERV